MMVFEVEVGAPVVVGNVGGAIRRYVPLLGGTVAGDYTGKIVPGGMDWQSVWPDGTIDIAARYVLELDQGTVEIRSEGLRAASEDVQKKLAAGEILPKEQYYFRTAMRFFTASSALHHLNHTLAIAVGERFPKHVRLAIHAIL